MVSRCHKDGSLRPAALTLARSALCVCCGSSRQGLSRSTVRSSPASARSVAPHHGASVTLHSTSPLHSSTNLHALLCVQRQSALREREGESARLSKLLSS
jgi:hypothetical protein